MATLHNSPWRTKPEPACQNGDTASYHFAVTQIKLIRAAGVSDPSAQGSVKSAPIPPSRWGGVCEFVRQRSNCIKNLISHGFSVF